MSAVGPWGEGPESREDEIAALIERAEKSIQRAEEVMQKHAV